MSESFLAATTTRKEDATENATEDVLTRFGDLQVSPTPPPNNDPVVGIYTSISGKIIRRVFQGIGRNIAGTHRKPPYYVTPGGSKCYQGGPSDRGSWALMSAEEAEAVMRALE